MKTIYSRIQENKDLVSVVIPVLNELENVKILNKFLKIAFKSKHIDYEIIYIDDHSTDGTFEYLLDIADFRKVFVYRKMGKKGKSYSLTEGFSHSRGNILAMIDADLQYPVTALVEMVELVISGSDVVVANRKKIKTSIIRKITSKGFRHIFGKVLFGLHTDVQSGLKVFRKRVYDVVSFTPQTPWTFDLEFLYRVREAGFKIRNFNITFGVRQNGDSKVQFLKQTIEIGSNALKVKARKIQPMIIPPVSKESMVGAGIGHKRKQFITHTTLPYHQTAFRTFIKPQLAFLLFISVIFLGGLIYNPLLTAQALLTIVSAVYFIDMIFNLIVVSRSLNHGWELKVSELEIDRLQDAKLPVYSILCPLYKEAEILPQFIDSINKLNWPKDKLDVLLLLEEDDKESIKAISRMILPSYMRPIIVPYSEPKTKPKACNYGLNFARGEYIVIFDAEDIPDPDQLKIAYCSFNKSEPNVICLQAKLNYYNPKQNLLTRFFTAEYSLWFDLTLPGFQSLQTSLPLGGTSNHFKTSLLKKLHGWDTFNVTEDADLGIRLFKEGYKTAIIESTTLEEANSNVHNWLRQRSRWIKGYLQSYLVHTRDIIKFARTNRLHALYMQLVIGTKLTFIFLNPILWVTTLSYFMFYRYVGLSIEAAYLPPAFYLGVVSLVFGNFLFFYYYMVGVAKKQQWELMKSSLFIPVYWLLISIAGWIALYQLIVKPHYWEKTIHGLHLGKDKPKDKYVPVVEERERRRFIPIPAFVYTSISLARSHKGHIATGSMLVCSTILAHLINLFFNIYLFRNQRVSIESVGLISLFSSFFYTISIFVYALEASSIHKTAVLDGKHGAISAYLFRKNIRKNLFYVSIIISLFWVAISPLMMRFFKLDSLFPFILFAPILIIAFEFALDRGYLSGKLLFGRLAVLIISEPLIKFVMAVVLVNIGLGNFSYIAIPYSFILAYVISALIFPKTDIFVDKIASIKINFPWKFYTATVLSGISGIAFLSLDIFLANHYLLSADAGKYALVSLVGKMTYFLSTLSSQFVLPLVSRVADKDNISRKILRYSLLGSAILSLSGLTVFAVFAKTSLPILLGDKAEGIIPYVLVFTIGIACFSLSQVISGYYLARRVYTIQVLVIFLTIAQIVLIYLRHDSLSVFIQIMSIIGVTHLVVMVLLHLNIKVVISFERSLSKFYRSISGQHRESETGIQNPAILIFNWRDIKHAWAGGAEVYIHEIAKRWVKQGVSVTIFSGYDNKSTMDETRDGIKMIRRGGKYTVYIWAMVYYLFILRKKHDVIIDCENGIPFFTPLYSNKPVFLLIYHVHQEVFKQYLPIPIAKIAAFLESKLMPLVYRNKQVITISESSKRAILQLGYFKQENIQIIYCGIDNKYSNPQPKTTFPTFIYLGRLKPHKNIDIGIKAFAKTLIHHPKAVLNIVGEGEEDLKLKSLVRSLNITSSVNFYGRVAESVKYKLLAESWIMLQPSGVEGWGITVIEANGSGTPVIASDVNGLRDSVVNNETGLLVEVKNVKQLALAMDYVLSNNVRRELYIKNALAWSKNFTWDKSAGDFLLIIREMLRKGSYRSSVKPAVAKVPIIAS